MFLSRGIALDTWVMASRECDISCEVIGNQAQLTLGHNTGSLNLVLDDGGLASLIEVAVDAWTRWQAVPAGELANFTVTNAEIDQVTS